MNCEKVTYHLVDYLTGDLDDRTKKAINAHLLKCEACKIALDETRQLLDKIDETPSYQPPDSLRSDFYQMLQHEKQEVSANEQKRKSSLKQVWSLAAQVVLLVGVGVVIGWYLSNKTGEQQQLAQLNQRLEELNRRVQYVSLDKPTASQRIKAINQINAEATPNEKMLDVLINTMNTDENTNVRMAAIYALSQYKNQLKVRKALINSLDQQTDPILQITLINLLVTFKEPEVKPALEDLIHKDHINNEVKKQAKQGLSVAL